MVCAFGCSLSSLERNSPSTFMHAKHAVKKTCNGSRLSCFNHSTIGCGARPVSTGSRRRREEWTLHHRSSRRKMSRSMMKIGNVNALSSVYRDHLTNMPRTMVTIPAQIFGTNTTCLKAWIGNKTHYYTTLSIFLYLQTYLHVLTRFDANNCIIPSVILTHSP